MNITYGTKRVGKLYKGVLRDEKKRVVWACDHYHTNRDQDSYDFIRHGHMEGMSANTCAYRKSKETQ